MRDGTRIALDVCLPDRVPPGGAPTILRQTRYYRATEYRAIARLLRFGGFDLYRKTRKLFLSCGYAWVDVDVRGSGASFGMRDCPLSPDEVRDGAEIVSWIVAQPWSSGRVGATGISYDGAAAELLLANEHPAVVAVAPLFSFYDAYTDVGFPGGIPSSWFTQKWQNFNQALDSAQAHSALSMQLRLIAAANLPHRHPLANAALRLVDTDRAESLLERLLASVIRGPMPVDKKDGKRLLGQALEERDNFDVHTGASAVRFRNDHGISERRTDATIDIFSPSSYADRSPHAAVFSYSGWHDGGYGRAAVQRFQERSCSHRELVLGPWGHGGVLDVTRKAPGKARWSHDRELLRFFNRHLRRCDTETIAPVRYFTMVEERWKSANAWPPPGMEEKCYYLADGKLTRALPQERGSTLITESQRGRGNRTRWNSLITGFGAIDHAGDGTDDGACFRTMPFERDIEITGHPLLRIWICAEDEDMQIFAYLQDEAPSGAVAWVTEGLLLASHRAHTIEAHGIVRRSFLREDAAPLSPGQPTELVFDLYPLSYQFRRGHSLRLQITTSDSSHFPPLKQNAPARVLWGTEFSSSLTLPVC